MHVQIIIMQIGCLAFLVLLAFLLESCLGRVVQGPLARWALFLLFLALGLLCFVQKFLIYGGAPPFLP